LNIGVIPEKYILSSLTIFMRLQKRQIKKSDVSKETKNWTIVYLVCLL